MQQFTVPQFIDVEDKIIGSVTTRQFVIVLAAFMLAAIYYKIFDFSLFITASIITLIIFGIFAFARVNGRPFHFFALNVIQTFKRPKLRVWNQSSLSAVAESAISEGKIVKKDSEIVQKFLPTSTRLTELSLIVDTRGMYKGEQPGASGEIKSIDNNKENNLNI